MTTNGKKIDNVDELELLLASMLDEEIEGLIEEDPKVSLPANDVSEEEFSEADLMGLDAIIEEEPVQRRPTRKPKAPKPLEPEVKAEIVEVVETEVETVEVEVRRAAATVVSDDDEMEALLLAASSAIEEAEAVSIPTTSRSTMSSGAASSGSSATASSGSVRSSGGTVRPVFNAKGDLNTFIDPDRLQEDLSFSTNNISTAMTRQAAMFAHYSNLSAQAAYQHDRAKQQVELLQATLDQRFRDDLTSSGTKFTEKVIESMIIKDASYQAAQTRSHEARAIAKMVDTAADSFRHRKDMLIQVGADLREEKKGNLTMKEHPGQVAIRHLSGAAS